MTSIEPIALVTCSDNEVVDEGQGRTCIFCGRGPATREHVFRDKLRENLPAHTDTLHISLSAPETNRSTKTSMFDRKVRAVCKACNGGWMNDLDVELEPALGAMIRGEPIIITRQLARRLAFWIAVRAVVRSQAERPESRLQTRALGAQIAASGFPPSGMSAWLGLTDAPNTFDGFNHFFIRRHAADENVKAIRMFQHTAAIGHALFVAVGPVDPEHERVGRAIGWDLKQAFDRNPFPLDRLWPRPVRINWPNTPALPLEMVVRDLHPAAAAIMQTAISAT